MTLTSVETQPRGLLVESCAGTAFGRPRNFLGNRFVYAVISPRAKGLSLGVNMNPDRLCNFDCSYCEVSRQEHGIETSLDTEVMAEELAKSLDLIRLERIREIPFFSLVPDGLLALRHVALSGDGEPTLCPNFSEAVQAVMHVRARCDQFFKIVLITNATGINFPEVQNGLGFFTSRDEIWTKLEAGTQRYMSQINGTEVLLEKVLENILWIGRARPVVIQSLFPSIHGRGPSDEEVREYALRLNELRAAGAQISLVQIYSATRPTAYSQCGHLPLRVLSQIAQTVRSVAGLNVEVY